MIEICLKTQCTGCTACMEACPKSCIKMTPDKYGEIHPVVDYEKCVECGRCVRVCPSNGGIEKLYPQKCYAAWRSDSDNRLKSASGGLATIIGEYVIRYCNGVVYGVGYDENSAAVWQKAEGLESLNAFKGSKYVQAVPYKGMYKEIKSFIEQNRTVLFTGTPCQVAGLRSFLGKDYKSLITCDLICHGVVPYSYLKEEADAFRRKYPNKSLSEIRFRENSKKNYCITYNVKSGNNQSESTFSRSAKTDYYFYGFLHGVTLRENCFSCHYSTPERVGDLTLGDYIGLGRLEAFTQRVSNVSSVTINTHKGGIVFNAVAEKFPNLNFEERPYEERLLYRPALREPSKRHPLREVFREEMLSCGYYDAIRKVLHNVILENRREERIERLISPFRLCRRVLGKIKRIVLRTASI